MTTLTIDIDQMVSSDYPIGVRQCRLVSRPGDGTYDADGLLAPNTAQFELDADGEATIEVAPNPSDTWYTLLVRDIGQWQLVVAGDTDTAHNAAARFNELRPDGGTPTIQTVPVVGPTGPQGPPGPAGPAGAAGAASVWYERSGAPSGWTFTGTLRANDWCFRTDDSTVYEYDGSMWNLVGSLTGGTGPQGPQGPRGERGPAGPAGAAGAAGAAGVRGRHVAFIFRQATSQPARPTGGSYDQFLDVLTVPSGWSTTPPTPSGQNRVWASVATLTPMGSTGTITPNWSPAVAWSGARGATGSAGADGQRGQQGATGPQGAQGDRGPEGPRGQQGPAASPTPLNAVAVGTSVTLSTTAVDVELLSDIPDLFLAVVTAGSGNNANEATELIIKADIDNQGIGIAVGRTMNRIVTLTTTATHLQAAMDRGAGSIRIFRVQGAGSGSGGTPVTPHTPASGDTELAGIDINGTDYEIVDAASRGRLATDESLIGHLVAQTNDLIPAAPVTGWVTATSQQGGIAETSAFPTLSTAANATGWAVTNAADADGRHVAIRLAAGANAAMYRLRFSDGTNVYEPLLSTFDSLGNQGSWDYYRPPDSSVITAALTLQTSSNSTAGRSTYTGNLETDKVQGALGVYVDDASISGETLTISREGGSDRVLTLPSGGGGTEVAPHTPTSADAALSGVDIGGTDYRIVDTEAQAATTRNFQAIQGLALEDLHYGWRVSDLSRATNSGGDATDQFHTVFDSRFAQFAFVASATEPDWDRDTLRFHTGQVNRPSAGWPSPLASIRFLVEVPNNGGPMPNQFRIANGRTNNLNYPMVGSAVTVQNARAGFVYYQTAAHPLMAADPHVTLQALGGGSGGHTVYNGLLSERSIGEALFNRVNPFVVGNAGRIIEISTDGGHFVVADKPSGGGGSTTGSIVYTQIGSATTLFTTGNVPTTAVDTGVDRDDLPDWFLVRVVYDDNRTGGNAGGAQYMTSQYQKAAVGVQRLQLRGFGGANIAFSWSGDNLMADYNAPNATYTNVSIEFYVVTGMGGRGATGPQGIQGPRGATGATGPQGPTGPQGALMGGGVTRIEAVADEDAYDAVTPKVATTLYIWS